MLTFNSLLVFKCVCVFVCVCVCVLCVCVCVCVCVSIYTHYHSKCFYFIDFRNIYVLLEFKIKVSI